jgi:predicted  nucleic acid-binding Zn-ribbon protein
VDLLRETLRAAAPEEMLEWQRQLQELYKEKKELAEAASTDAETLQNLENRNQGLQADVDRVREREEIQEQVRNLEGALVVAKYEDVRRRMVEAKKKRKEAEESLKSLEESSGPSLQAINDKQSYARQIEDCLPLRQSAVEDAERTAGKLAADVRSLSDKIKALENDQAAERKGFETKKKDVAASRSKLTALQADLKNRPPEFNAAEWNQRIRAEEHTQRDLEAEQREITTQRDTIKDKGRAVNQDLQRIEADLKSFDTQQGQQLNFMRKHFPEIAAGWDWVQEHQGDFEKEVFGPPMISCSVKDERYSDQVQSLLQSDDFTCFTAQTRADYKRLTDQLYRVMSLSVVVRTCSHPLESFRSPLSPTEAAALGLDGFAVNYLEGPSPVLAMLCAEKRLHQSGVSLEDHNDSQYDQLVNNGRIGQWAAGKQSYTVRRRKEYGPQAMTTITKNIQPGRFWTSQPVDFQEKEDLNRQLEAKTSEKDVLKTEYRELQNKLESIVSQKDDILGKIVSGWKDMPVKCKLTIFQAQLRVEKGALQKDYQKWQSLPEKIGRFGLSGSI